MYFGACWVRMRSWKGPCEHRAGSSQSRILTLKTQTQTVTPEYSGKKPHFSTGAFTQATVREHVSGPGS